ncbi:MULTISPECIES: DoxX family protein [unclassified Photobacterium]|uniref:DoxX family protein n=1 Tax=unclassified Photobacterium TaxID=2628852 RepID=UPI001B8B0279|nr:MULTISPECIES: DoxX family protein [unclassified Photobacterium]MDO6708286.1 DoxX family protein [Photobacterium sp. 1_MG-2023]QUJ67413.1 DoxX family protein [Photobacterium sp. GJ3]
MFYYIKDIDNQCNRILTPLKPLLLLLTRLWVAWIFFNSGLIKYQSWDSTLYLFEYEYQVPLLPWRIAAYLGTAAELILPVFLVLGLLTRPMALLLFVFNMIAVVSYPLLWEKGFYDHQLWGMMLLVNVFWGAGLLSLDHLSGLARRPSRLLE